MSTLDLHICINICDLCINMHIVLDSVAVSSRNLLAVHSFLLCFTDIPPGEHLMPAALYRHGGQVSTLILHSGSHVFMAPLLG